jgi:hypothetical protein
MEDGITAAKMITNCWQAWYLSHINQEGYRQILQYFAE